STTGPHLRGAIRRAFPGGYRLRRKRRGTWTGEPENYAGGSAIARGARDFPQHAGKHELGDGRTRGRTAAVYTGRARRDDQSGRGKISRRTGGTVSWAARNGNFPSRASSARGAAH